MNVLDPSKRYTLNLTLGARALCLYLFSSQAYRLNPILFCLNSSVTLKLFTSVFLFKANTLNNNNNNTVNLSQMTSLKNVILLIFQKVI